MSEEFPEALQIEVTNRCNFKCQMCMRRVWETELLNMDLALYKKIAESCFHKLKRLILYGVGEPFIHPHFIEMLRIARKTLKEDGKIIVSTNGSLITPRIARKIVREIGLGSISFSVDTTDQIKLSRVRGGSELSLITENVGYLTKNRDKPKNVLDLGIEIVIMADNFRDLPDLIKFSAESEIDYIIASHVASYTEDVLAKALYLTMSKNSIEILKPSINYGRDIIRKVTVELFGKTYGVEMEPVSSKLVKNFWRKAEKKGYWINLPLFLNSIDKLGILNDLEEVFNQSAKLAHEYQIDLKLPNLFSNAKKRECPYMEKKTLIIRSDGKVSPCLEFMYQHQVYVNAHKKDVREIIFGDATKEDIEEVWRKGAYKNFREIRQNMVENMPWCGDCPFSTLGCFYTKTNNIDCYANEPTCDECLYSVNLVQCNI
ncbi:MAG: radical SAM protein [Candidatus Bathyarchaeia archaeon]